MSDTTPNATADAAGSAELARRAPADDRRRAPIVATASRSASAPAASSCRSSRRSSRS